MLAYTRAMSTTETRRPSDDCPTAVIPAVIPAVPVRRSILRQARPAHPRTMAPPFADWRCQAVTEEQAAVAAVPPTSTRRASRRTTLRRHLRCALVGTLLAIVAITGLSAYAAAGIADARSPALRQAHISCK